MHRRWIEQLRFRQISGERETLGVWREEKRQSSRLRVVTGRDPVVVQRLIHVVDHFRTGVRVECRIGIRPEIIGALHRRRGEYVERKISSTRPTCLKEISRWSRVSRRNSVIWSNSAWNKSRLLFVIREANFSRGIRLDENKRRASMDGQILTPRAVTSPQSNPTSNFWSTSTINRKKWPRVFLDRLLPAVVRRIHCRSLWRWNPWFLSIDGRFRSVWSDARCGSFPRPGRGENWANHWWNRRSIPSMTDGVSRILSEAI